MYSDAALCVLMLLYVSSYCYICVRILLCMYSDAALCVLHCDPHPGILLCMYPHAAQCVLIPILMLCMYPHAVFMCPHAATYVSAYCCVCILTAASYA